MESCYRLDNYHLKLLTLRSCIFSAYCLTCNKCSESATGKGDCGTEQRCSTQQTRCVAKRWGSNQIQKKSNTYDTRCATAEECSSSGRNQLCAGQDCEARCCDFSKCDPFGHHEVIVTFTSIVSVCHVRD